MVLPLMRRDNFVPQALICASLALLSSCSSRPAATEAPRTYQMGERVVLAPLTYAVYEKQWLAELGTGPDARLPQNRFLLIRISATNGGGGDAYVPNLTLEDDAGQTCNEVTNGDAVPHWVGMLRSVKPVDSLQGNVLFDCVPKHYRLKLPNEEGKFAYVDIPLSFDADTPGSVPIPSKDDKTGGLAHPK